MIATPIIQKLYKKLSDKYRKLDQFDTILFIILLSLITEQCSQLFKIISIISYSYNGMNILLLDLLSEFFNMITQLIITFILFLLACGYMVNHKNINIYNIIPSLIFMVCFHLFLISVGKYDDYQDKGSYKHHPYECSEGTIIAIFKIIFLFVFVFSIQQNQYSEDNNSKRTFVRLLLIQGIIWLINWPLILLLLGLIQSHERQFYFIILTKFLELFGIGLLVKLFNSTTSRFTNIFQNKSSILPGSSFKEN